MVPQEDRKYNVRFEMPNDDFTTLDNRLLDATSPIKGELKPQSYVFSGTPLQIKMEFEKLKNGGAIHSSELDGYLSTFIAELSDPNYLRTSFGSPNRVPVDSSRVMLGYNSQTENNGYSRVVQLGLIAKETEGKIESVYVTDFSISDLNLREDETLRQRFLSLEEEGWSNGTNTVRLKLDTEPQFFSNIAEIVEAREKDSIRPMIDVEGRWAQLSEGIRMQRF